jgi:hypothetical protein
VERVFDLDHGLFYRSYYVRSNFWMAGFSVYQILDTKSHLFVSSNYYGGRFSTWRSTTVMILYGICSAIFLSWWAYLVLRWRKRNIAGRHVALTSTGVWYRTTTPVKCSFRRHIVYVCSLRCCSCIWPPSFPSTHSLSHSHHHNYNDDYGVINKNTDPLW